MDPKELLNNPEQIKALIDVLQALLPKTDTQEVSQPKVEKKTKKTKPKPTEQKTNIKTRNRKHNYQTEVNLFEQMSEFNMHKDDAIIDQKLAKHPPVARTREFEPIEVVCRVCGKRETVSPALVHEGPARYKCNGCSTHSG